MISINSNIKNNEFKLLKIVLITSVVFWFLGMIKGFWFNGEQTILILDSLSFSIAVVILVALVLGGNPELLAKLFCLSWLPMFVIYWKYYGGVEGSITYVYFTVLVIFLGLLQGKSRLFMTIILCLVNLILTLDAEAEILIKIAPIENLINPLSVNYLFNSTIVAAIVVFIKVRFDKEREDIETQNQYLDRLNQELSIKNELLSNQQQQIKSIQNNLEELVHERTLELENRNKELETYAYDNAHVVRRPLSNILSLLDILNEEDREGIQKSQLKDIQKNAKDLDEVVQKINMILH
ncbi:hypothetical protein SAMN04488029_0550 [Reichenbachiella faecimaris]|uniref:Histidine kinase n=1 Tax=Reichenbachiella faecimaris TaxID=692418 RepID=A0A1W2G786_REIFA|nr:hypothetical protein [Reichenbachiella faecimaris]SMD32208.1 hypothetical protein SAMN04488029_0550 [Reichenbachiella faecimaris]